VVIDAAAAAAAAAVVIVVVVTLWCPGSHWLCDLPSPPQFLRPIWLLKTDLRVDFKALHEK